MISLVIPTYNEKNNIRELLERIGRALKGKKFEIIIVDDNSPDGTGKFVRSIGKPNTWVLTRRRKRGLSGALVYGMKRSRGDIIVIMDADLSHPPEKIPELIEKIDGGCEIVVASRYAPGGGIRDWPFYRRIISMGATALAKLVVTKKASDPVSGFFAFKRELLGNIRFRTMGYKILLNVLRDADDSKICEVPFVFEERRKGKTKLGMGEIFAYIKDIVVVRFG